MIDNSTLPINCITGEQAITYASWLDTQDGAFTHSLPSESQWEYAARSQGQDHSLPGDVAQSSCDTITAFGSQCGYSTPTSVCSRSRNLVDVANTSDTEQGLCDMAGSTFEWVLDDLNPRFPSGIPDDGSAYEFSRRGIVRRYYFMTRSGSWSSSRASNLVTTYRAAQYKTTRSNAIGFRVIRVPKPLP